MSVAGVVIIVLVALQRLAELIIDRRNTVTLLSEGGEEHGARHYPLFILLHSSWLVSLFYLVATQPIAIQWSWIGLYLILQIGRVWVIRTLGPYWTTRVITIVGRPLVKDGPYRFVRHPNYLIVVAEIAVLPLALGAWAIALLFSVLNAILLFHRISLENAVLNQRR